MKFSYYKLFIIVLISAALFSCSKEGTSSDSAINNSTGVGGSLSKFTIVGNFLYAVDNSYLYAWDISDPNNPRQTNSSYLSFGVETIYPFGNRLFIGSTTGMFIYSLDDPGIPVQVGSASHVRSCDPVVANDSIAFVTLKGNTRCGPAVSGLYVHDIRNVFNPQLINTTALPDPEGLGLKGSVLYVCCNDNGMKVMNVANPAHPVEIRTVTGAYFKDVIPYGNLLICYVTTGIMLYDISDPTNPVAVKLIQNT